jgi:hypothetical protein
METNKDIVFKCGNCKISQMVKTIYFYMIGGELIKYCMPCARKKMGSSLAASKVVGWRSSMFSGGTDTTNPSKKNTQFIPWKPSNK